MVGRFVLGLLIAAILILAISVKAQNAPPGISVQPGMSGKFLLNFKGASIETVIDELARVPGFSVITLSPTNHERVSSIVNLSGVSADEAMTLINVALNELGYAAIRQGEVIKILRRSDAMTKDIPVRTFASAKDVPLTDELITGVIALRWANAVQLQNDLRPLVDANAIMTANASSNALILTDVSSSIHRVIAIVDALDSHVTQASGVRVIPLKHSNAAEMARLVNDIYRNVQNDSANSAEEPGRGDPAPRTRNGRTNRGPAGRSGGGE